MELGTKVIGHRVKTLHLINKKIKNIYQLMTGNNDILKLKYNSNILTSYSEDREEIQKVFEQKLSDFSLAVATTERPPALPK